MLIIVHFSTENCTILYRVIDAPSNRIVREETLRNRECLVATD